MIIISPSILSANPLTLEKDVINIENGGADWHHIDVMDGHFVPNLTFGIPTVKALKAICNLPLDTHLMITNPDTMAVKYIQAGSDILTFHVEASKHPYRLIQEIQSHGAKAGIAINPGTPIESLVPLLKIVDLVLIMSVNPGFGGQTFIPETLERLSTLDALLNKTNRKKDVIVQVDGGINSQTIKDAYCAGARSFVAGSFIYNAKNPMQAISSLRESIL